MWAPAALSRTGSGSSAYSQPADGRTRCSAATVSRSADAVASCATSGVPPITLSATNHTIANGGYTDDTWLWFTWSASSGARCASDAGLASSGSCPARTARPSNR